MERGLRDEREAKQQREEREIEERGSTAGRERVGRKERREKGGRETGRKQRDRERDQNSERGGVERRYGDIENREKERGSRTSSETKYNG